jgi:Ca2+-binding RTX toxin-like protein
LGADLENLTLLGGGNLTGTGNSLDNRLVGNGGNNFLIGGLGRDIMTGNGGVDRFDFNALAESGVTAATRDIISDFDAGSSTTSVDRIDLLAIDANELIGGNQIFTFVTGGGPLATGQARAVQAGANTLIQLNTDADAAAEMVIQLNGVLATNVNAGDFFL